MPGQILRTTNTHSLSVASSENVKPISSWGETIVKFYMDREVSLSIETVDFSSIKNRDCKEHQQYYDKCIISQFLQNGNNSGYSELLLYNATQLSRRRQMVPIEVVQKYYDIIKNRESISKCPESCSYFLIKFDQKTTREYLIMQFVVTNSKTFLFNIMAY
jgi:hypothetical protein